MQSLYSAILAYIHMCFTAVNHEYLFFCYAYCPQSHVAEY